jgi:photosystem II stability/assembly factor-like uncharacterized protein
VTLVRDAPVTTELDPANMAVGPEALFKEARRRRRRRWTITGVLVLVLVSVVYVIGVDVSGSGPHRPPPSGSHGGPRSGTNTQQHRSLIQPASAFNNATISQMGRIGTGPPNRDALWAINGSGAYLTTDGGRHWRNITPASLRGVGAGERLGSVAGIGASDLWLPVHEVVGVVPPGTGVDGSTRGAGIERSTNGGRTWTFTALPGCVQICGDDIDLSFISQSDGFALTGPPDMGALHLYATTDGGASWAKVSDPSFHGDRTSMVFTTIQQGWAVTDATHTASIDDPGGVAYQTTDGGRTWHVVRSLPGAEQFQPPIFMTAGTGVILAQDPRLGAQGRATVFVTTNGGRTWSSHPAPTDAGLSRYLPTDLSVSAPPFSAITPSQWAMFVGPALYRTSDAGQHWERVAAQPRWSPGAVLSLFFGTPSRGWVVAYVPDCEPMAGIGPCTPIGPSYLMTTSNGGRRWRAAPYWQAAARYSDPLVPQAQTSN